MFSLLNSLDEYIKEKGIPFKYLKIHYSYLPDYINQVILNHIRENCIGNDVELGPENYQLEYSNNGILYLLAKDTKEHVNIVISTSNESLDVDFPYRFIPEKKIIREACILKEVIKRKRLEEEQLKISKKSTFINYEETLKRNKEINECCLSVFKDMIAIGEDILKYVDYEKYLEKSYKEIINYIDYINKMYQDSINSKFNNYHMNGIRYNEPIGMRSNRSTGSSNIEDSNLKERVNQVIPVSDRINAIEDYPYLYKDYAYKDTTTREIIYMNYLFRTSKDNYILLIEPYNGMGYTKMIFLESEEFITRDDFAKTVQNYLELPFMEILKHKNIINCCHTRMETFEAILKCALIKEESNLINIPLRRKLKNQR